MKVFLPGLKKQYDFLTKKIGQAPTSILVIGSSSEWIAVQLAKKYKCPVELIVEDYESLLNSKMVLGDDKSVNLRMMNYDSTDFVNSQFDLIFAQGSISLENRNKIIKELKRIMKQGAVLCVGEIIVLNKNLPVYVQNIFDNSGMQPLFAEEVSSYYKERKFECLAEEDLSNTFKEYYEQAAMKLKEEISNLSEREKSYYKKLLKKISHESNAYLKLGGDKYIGFITLLLQKGDS